MKIYKKLNEQIKECGSDHRNLGLWRKHCEASETENQVCKNLDDKCFTFYLCSDILVITIRYLHGGVQWNLYMQKC
jgi:hypothetical protein